MQCQEIQEQFLDLLYNEAGTPKASPELLAHLRACARCQKELEELKGLRSLLKTWQDEPIPHPIDLPHRQPAMPFFHRSVWSYVRYAAAAALVVLAFLGLSNASVRWDKNGFSFSTSLFARPAPQALASSDYYNKEEVREIMTRFLDSSQELNYQMIQRALEVVDEARSMDAKYFNTKLKEGRPKN